MRPKPIFVDSSRSSELSTTVDQWREALASSSKPKYPEGKTVSEIAQELTLPRSTVRAMLDRAVRSGTCKAYKDFRKNRLTTVYIVETEQ